MALAGVNKFLTNMLERLSLVGFYGFAQAQGCQDLQGAHKSISYNFFAMNLLTLF